jgi:hypothetical protein
VEHDTDARLVLPAHERIVCQLALTLPAEEPHGRAVTVHVQINVPSARDSRALPQRPPSRLPVGSSSPIPTEAATTMSSLFRSAFARSGGVYVLEVLAP